MADFNSEPYYDDFEASNGAKDQNYMRILFRPGYAVQARELTQIQSIIQNQIKQFGDHIFKDGSPVYGGHITLDTTTSYLKLQTAYEGVDVDVQDFENLVVYNATGSAKIRAKVLAIDETQTNPTLMVRYLRGNRFSNNDVIRTATGVFAQLTPTSATGVGSVASIAEGVFYVDGYFVKVQPQTIVLDAYSNSPTYKIGLEIDDTIVDESADANLLDPAQNSFNYQAPGAHRYQFALNLAKRTLDSIDDGKFFELLRVENGLITKQVNYPIYSEIEKTLARRTFDESGDYTVKPFGVNVQENLSDANTFIVNVEPGKAYVKGFEYETQATQKLILNRARTANTSTDYDLSIEYGNYLVVTDVLAGANGFFDLSKLQDVHLHCVPTSNVRFGNVANYAPTFMGTARALNFDRLSTNDYTINLIDIKLQPNTVVVTGGSTTTFVLPTSYANINNAYNGVEVRVISGAAAGDVKTVDNYFASNLTCVVNSAFTGAVTNGDQLQFNYDVKAIKSIIQPVIKLTDPIVPAPNTLASNVSANIAAAGKNPITGYTELRDSNKRSLLFMLPEAYIKANTISNADFIHRKYFSSKTFTGTPYSKFSLTLSGNETFNYGSDGTDLSDSTANNNIIVIVKDAQSSNFATGQIANIQRVARISSTQLDIYPNYIQANGKNFVADIIATVKVNDSESGSNNRRTKTLRGNTSITSLRATDNSGNATDVVGEANEVKIDTANGFVWFLNASEINKIPGANNSLFIPDVVKIIKVYDSANTLYEPSSSNTVYDITNRYYLDPGQSLTQYDHAKLVLKPGAQPPTGQVVVMLQYYEHSSAINGYFDVDSYSTLVYDSGEIPVYVDSDGTRYNLRDAIDFRPTREIGTVSTSAIYTYNGLKVPKPDEPMELTYSYYVPRIDKIILTKDRELKVLEGIASKYPVEPVDSENAMTLFKINIPAYTARHTDVRITPIENKRYSMRDIGRLETRLKNVEYYTALNYVEKKAVDTVILYEDNITEKEKYGLLVDNFTGFSSADFKNADFRAAIENGVLFPYAILRQIPLEVATVNSYAQKNDKTVSLTYTEEPAIEQTTATTTTSVQPYLYGKFDGTMKLVPATDSWYSTSIPPAVVSPSPTIPPNPDPGVTVSPIPTETIPVTTPDPTVDLFDPFGTIGSTPITNVVDDWFSGGSGSGRGRNSSIRQQD